MVDDWLSNTFDLDDDTLDDYIAQATLPDDFYVQIILTIRDHAPLLAQPPLARAVMTTLTACAPEIPGQLWGYVLLPQALRLIVGPTKIEPLDTFVDRLKQCTSTSVLRRIQRADDDTIDSVMCYHPFRGGVTYQVWQAGIHRVLYRTEYRLSNALYELLQVPVEAGLVDNAADWPYRFTSGSYDS